MNTIVIDGYNLIHRVDYLREFVENKELEAARGELERIFSSYLASRKGVRAVVVYDSSDLQGNAAGRGSYPGVGVRFAPCADDVVVELAFKYAREGDYVRVVSSDRAGVGSQLAGERRIEVLASDKFWSTALAARGGRKDRAGSRKKIEQLNNEKPGKVSKAEVEYWLRAFGETGEGEREGEESVENAVEDREPSEREPDKSNPGLKEIKKKRYLRRQKRRR